MLTGKGRAADVYGITELILEALGHPGGPLAGACERAGSFLRGWWGEPPGAPFAPASDSTDDGPERW